MSTSTTSEIQFSGKVTIAWPNAEIKDGTLSYGRIEYKIVFPYFECRIVDL